jgi:hypothetical protein
MLVKYTRKPPPRSVICRRARKLLTEWPLCQYIRSRPLALSFLVNSLNYMVQSLLKSLPICLWKIYIFQEHAHRLERQLSRKRNLSDLARTERPSNQTGHLHMLWNNFQLKPSEKGWQSCSGQLCLSRLDLWCLAGNSLGEVSMLGTFLRTCSPNGGGKRWWRWSCRVLDDTLQVKCTGRVEY